MSGKSSAKVYDYRLSVDYALCYGPVDSVNQVWIKDKPIWCGEASTRTDIGIDLPELFGGDDAEGGVEGVVEVYLGTEDQVSSDQLARRFGRTALTMPGYRGICHLFFRGYGTIAASDDEIITAGGTVPDDDGVFALISSTLRNLRSKAKNLGFKWTTNNPYFPEVKANVTRTPDVLGDGLNRIWIYGEPTENPDAYDWSGVAGGGGVYVNTHGLNFDQNGEATDTPTLRYVANGLATFEYRYRVRCVYNGTLGTTPYAPAMCTYGLQVFQLDADGGFLSIPAGGLTSYSVMTDGIVDITLNGPIHPKCKVIRFTAMHAPLDVITSTVQIGQGTIGKEIYVTGGIHCLVDGTLGPLPDANPAHIMYEVMTSGDFGMEEDTSLMDLTEFLNVSATLYAERFGLSLMWTQQTEIKAFLLEILNHIQGFLFQNPNTGLWMPRLLRKDPDAELSPVLDPSNCVLKNPKRIHWDSTKNEIIVTWTDPATEEEATVSQQALANIQVRGGGINSETRNYYGVRNEILAQKLADRDVAKESYPLWTGQIEMMRTATLPVPGDRFVLNWPEDGIFGMVVVVMKPAYGKPGDRSITLDVTEDIFAIDAVRYRDPQGSEWDNDVKPTTPLDAVLVMGAPGPVYYRNGYSPDTFDDNYPDVGINIFGTADTYTLLDVNLQTYTTSAAGTSEQESIKTLAPALSLLLDTGTDGVVIFPAESETIVPGEIFAFADDGTLAAGDMFVLGGSELYHEIIMLKADTGAGWTVARGIYDTIPREWVSPVRLWQYSPDAAHADPTTRSVGESCTYKLTPRGFGGSSTVELSTDVLHPASARPYMPFRPANVSLDGHTFSQYISNGFPGASVTASWSTRNRMVEDGIAALWDGGTVTPESGQTVALLILDELGQDWNRISGITGSSYTLTEADFVGISLGSVKFIAEMDGFDSLMGAEVQFDFRTYGYGNNYGYIYGGKT